MEGIIDFHMKMIWYQFQPDAGYYCLGNRWPTEYRENKVHTHTRMTMIHTSIVQYETTNTTRIEPIEL